MHLTRVLPATVVGTTLLLTAAGRAQAQPTTATPRKDSALESATDRFEEGKRLFRQGKRDNNPAKIERAYDEFKAAYAIYRGKGTLLNLVESELATGRALDAMIHLREYVRAYGVPDEQSEYRGTFAAQWDPAFNATGHIEVDAPGSLRIVVDGKDDVGLTPLTGPIDVSPGHHAIAGVGVETIRTEVEAPAGATVRVALESAQPSMTPPLVVAPIPGDLSPPPQAPLGMPVGPTLGRPFWTPSRTWGVLAGGMGVLSLGAGVAFAIQANQEADRAASLAAALGPSGCVGARTQACQDLQSTHDDQSRDHALNLAFVGLGAAAVVVGAVLLLWSMHSRSAAAVAPTMSAHGAGLEMRGEL